MREGPFRFIDRQPPVPRGAHGSDCRVWTNDGDFSFDGKTEKEIISKIWESMASGILDGYLLRRADIRLFLEGIDICLHRPIAF